MGNMTFKIKQSKKITIRLLIFGFAMTFIGILFSFILDNELTHRPYYIGTPLIIGVLILAIIKVAFPTENIGRLIINDIGIEIQKTDSLLKLAYNDIENIRLNIYGYEMELKRNWWILSREFFPFEHGHNNEIIIATKEKAVTKSNFFLNNKREEKELIDRLTAASKDFNFNLKI